MSPRLQVPGSRNLPVCGNNINFATSALYEAKPITKENLASSSTE